MDLKLTGKVVVVTGATANIGRAIALDFATEGAKLVAVGRDVTAGERLVAQALSRGAQQAIFVRADLLDPKSPARILEAAASLSTASPLMALCRMIRRRSAKAAASMQSMVSFDRLLRTSRRRTQPSGGGPVRSPVRS